MAALGAAVATGCGAASPLPQPTGGTSDKTKMYRLSTKGQRASNAAKSNAANKLFASVEAALAGRAHPGDRAKVVPLDTTPATWDLLFLDGRRPVIDLRRA